MQYFTYLRDQSSFIPDCWENEANIILRSSSLSNRGVGTAAMDVLGTTGA